MITENSPPENIPHWKEVDEGYLMEHFVSDPPMTKEERTMVNIDPSKVHFVESPFDRYYYSDRYPLLGDDVCVMLEQCSIDKTKQPTPPPPHPPTVQDKDDDMKIKGVLFRKDSNIITFD